MKIDGIEVIAQTDYCTLEDMQEATKRAIAEHGKENIKYITMCFKDGYVGYRVRLKEFDRIRRITGYLVGNMNSWNNAKRSEEQDRVKHN